MGSIEIIKPLLSTALSSSTVDKLWQHKQLVNKLSGASGIEPGAAKSRSANAIHCAMPPPLQVSVNHILDVFQVLKIPLKQHMRVHQKERLGCQKRFKNEDVLKSHMDRGHARPVQKKPIAVKAS